MPKKKKVYPPHLADRPISPHTYKNHKCKCKDCTAAWAAYMGPKVTRWRHNKKSDTL